MILNIFFLILNLSDHQRRWDSNSKFVRCKAECDTLQVCDSCLIQGRGSSQFLMLPLPAPFGSVALPSSLPLPQSWNFSLPRKINRFGVRFCFQLIFSKCFRFHTILPLPASSSTFVEITVIAFVRVVLFVSACSE